MLFFVGLKLLSHIQILLTLFSTMYGHFKGNIKYYVDFDKMFKSNPRALCNQISPKRAEGEQRSYINTYSVRSKELV